MPLRFDANTDVLLVVDLQSSLLEVIHEKERVLSRACFLIEVAQSIGVPIVATEQAPDRLGPTDQLIREALGVVPIFAKTDFSAAGCPSVHGRLSELERTSLIVVGVETHICVCGTALDFLDAGYRVSVCPDATSSRSLEAHKLGMERIRDAGAMPAHTESVVYEWLGGSTHPMFKRVLAAVKARSV